MLEMTAKYQSITIRMNYNENDDKIVLIDKLRMQQIMINVIQNAIKFSQKGGNIDVGIEYN